MSPLLYYYIYIMPTEFKVIMSVLLIGILIGIWWFSTVGNEKLQTLFKSLLWLDIVLWVLYILYSLWN